MEITLKVTEMDGRTEKEDLSKDSCEAPHRTGRIHQAEMGRAPSENAPAVCARRGDGEEWASAWLGYRPIWGVST